MENKYEKLTSAIEDRKNELLSLINADYTNGRKTYLEMFFDRYSAKRITSIANLQPAQLLLAYVLEQDRETEYYTIEEQVLDIKDYFNELNSTTIYSMGHNAQQLDDKKIDEIIELDKENTVLSRIMTQKKIKELLTKLEDEDMKSLSTKSIVDFLKVIKLIKKIKKINYINFLSFISSFYHKIEELRMLNFIIDEEILDVYINSEIKSYLNQSAIEKELVEVQRYYDELNKKEMRENRTRNKQLYNYIELLDLIKQEKTKKEIKNIDKYLDKISDDYIRILCLEYINEHNQEYYKQLEEEYNYKSENAIGKYISYFDGIGINFLTIDEDLKEKILTNSIEEVKRKVNVLLKHGITSDKLVLVIANSSLETIMDIEQLSKNYYLNNQWLSNNLSIYYDDNVLNNVKNNIRLLTSEKINIKVIENKDFLLTNSEVVAKNLKMLKNLNISLKTKRFTSLQMLSDETLDDKIASLVEVGLDEILINNPDILNADNNLVKRIIISQLVGNEIIENNELKTSVLDKDAFFVADNKVDDYLLDRNNSNYNCANMITFTQIEMENEKLYYDIEGVKVPKLRVSNLCVSLESIIRPSLYSREQVKILEKSKAILK